MDIEKLSKCGTIKNYNKGDIVCMEGQIGETAYLLLQGSVTINIGSFSDKSRKMAEIKSGSMFGEMSLLENAARSATVTAACDNTLALEIGKDDFILFMKTDPDLAYNLLLTLKKRTEESMEKYKGYMIAFYSQVNRDTMYRQITNLSQAQFVNIVKQDENYALKLLKYLSQTLAQINNKVIELGI